MSGKRGLIGLGIGVAAAGAATAVGVATDRVVRARRKERATRRPADDPELEQRGSVVVADDGVPLYVEIDEPAGRARCRDCTDEFELEDPFPLCPCGSAQIEVLAGAELRIVSVEVAPAQTRTLSIVPGK